VRERERERERKRENRFVDFECGPCALLPYSLSDPSFSGYDYIAILTRGTHGKM